MGRNEGRSFFRRAVDTGRHQLTMPVKLLRRVGVIEHVHGNRPAFVEAQQRTGELPVVGDG